MKDTKAHIYYLHIFVLVGFALAQPLYDLIGQYPTFLVAHDVQGHVAQHVCGPVCMFAPGRERVFPIPRSALRRADDSIPKIRPRLASQADEQRSGYK